MQSCSQCSLLDSRSSLWEAAVVVMSYIQICLTGLLSYQYTRNMYDISTHQELQVTSAICSLQGSVDAQLACQHSTRDMGEVNA